MTPDIHAHRILILDFGAQYTQLIARRVRELGVYCEIHPWDLSDAEVRAFGARGVILSGGPESVTEAVSPRAPQAVFELGMPVLGICYGMQTMAQQLGGRVAAAGTREFGYAEVQVASACRLFDGISDREHDGAAVLDVWMSHGDRVEALPPGFVAAARTADAPLAAMADERRALLRRAVSSRSHAHAPGRGAARALRARDLRLRGALDRRQHHRGSERAACARRSATAGCCWGCPAAWIPRWSRRCCTARSASS